ncbi:MAG: glycosyltransferase [Lachnospiraceae bacterium]|nr:glycosyltransferase [Lachnospiraceae bacterium]
MKKIVLIGPVYPYRGGISHYTGLMYRELSKKHEVELISYKMQYPKLLFKKEQRDYENDSFKIDAAKFMINTANPFNIIKTAKYIKRKKPDMVIIQWWHPYFAPCYWLLSKFMGRQNLTFVCHNVFPHERFPLDKRLTRMALKNGRHFIVHAHEEARELEQIMPHPDCKVTPHPSYNAFCFQNLTKAQARKKLGLSSEEKVLLFFGFVRPYKGLKHLIHAMPEIKARLDNVKLLIAGEFPSAEDKSAYMAQINELAASAPGIEDAILINDGYTPDREVEKYFAACDMVALPYESATQSGIVQIAYGFGKPVVVTSVGGLPDAVTDGRTGCVVAPRDDKALADAIVRYFEENKEPEFAKNIAAEAYRFSWERMGEVVEGWI